MTYPILNEQLISLSKRGIFCAPLENYKNFILRVSHNTSCEKESTSSAVQKLYDIVPDWVQLIYKNDSLHFWEGGCTWEDEGKVVIQVRKAFENKKRLYGIYKKEELVAHELVHAVRAPLKSIVFEEMFAYQTSESRLRRYWGPLVRTPRESLYYVVSWLLFFLATPWFWLQLILFWINMGMVTYAVIRLLGTRRKFDRVQKKVTYLFGDKKKALPFMIHLTDNEIFLFAKLKPEEIAKYIKEGSKEEVRLAQIQGRFFK